MKVRRHRWPEGSVLYRAVASGLEEFLRLGYASGVATWFIEKAYREYLNCGIPERGGSVIVECQDCGHREKVPRSCRRRGVCHWCMIRIMKAEAAELVEKVLPVATYRHVIVSYPFWLNKKLGFNPELLSRVERIVTEVLTKWAADRCNGRGGGMLVRHRAREDLEMGIHDHVLLLDVGFTWVPEATNTATGEVEVWKARETQQEDIDALAARLWKRIERFLAGRGITNDPKKSANKDEPREPAMEQQELFAKHAGTKDHRGGAAVGPTEEDEVEEPKDGMWARVAGLHVYVSPPIDGADRSNLEWLCRYLLRPPFSLGRLGQREDGKLTYRLKRKDKAGNTVLVLTPLELMMRLASLIPGPRQRLRKLFGILAPRSPGRKKVMPKPSDDKCRHAAPDAKQSAQERPKGPDLAKLLGNIPTDELLKCPRCLGRMTVIHRLVFPSGEQCGTEAIDREKRARGPPEKDAASAQPAA